MPGGLMTSPLIVKEGHGCADTTGTMGDQVRPDSTSGRRYNTQTVRLPAGGVKIRHEHRCHGERLDPEMMGLASVGIESHERLSSPSLAV